MSRTYTPELNPDVLDRLAEYAASFRDDFNRPRQAARCGVYLRGLITDGDRKSAEPMAARAPLPRGPEVADPDQAPRQFLGQSTWDERAVLKRYRAAMAAKFADPAGIFVIDDTTFPEQGSRLRRRPAAVLRRAGQEGRLPARRLGPLRRPEGPLPARHAALPPGELAGRPGAAGRGPRARGRAAVADQGPDRPGIARPGPRRGAGGLVAADSGYGVSGPSRDGPDERGLPYIVGVTDERVVFTEEPRWDAPKAGTGGRPQKRRRLAEGSPRPVSLREPAARTPRRKVAWREGTKGPMSGRFAWLRVRPAEGWATGDCAGAEPIWLLIEEQADGELKYAFSDLPADASRLRAVRLWRSRWPVEWGYQQMKEELGLDHHEGRSWRGFHHHACLVMLAFGFLTLEKRRARRDRSRPGKKGEAGRR